MIWLAFFLVSFASLFLWSRRNKAKRLPPGPRGLPILGSLHMLGSHPHRDLHQLAQKYGPVMFLRLGFVPTIVVSSPQAAELFLKTHDLVFASRPPNEAAKYIAWGQRNLSFGEYGSYWRNMRKMCTLELLSSAKINSFRTMRQEELDLLVNVLREASNNGGAAVDVSAKIATLTADMSCRMILGKKYMDQDLDEKGFKAVMQEALYLAAIPNIGDYIPYIGALDLQGLTRRMKAIGKIFDGFFEKIIDEHMKSEDKEGKVKDFSDVMLGFVGNKESEYHIERPNIKAILLDMLVGSIDTTATAIEWALSELMKNPRMMKKLQMELEKVVGMNRKVEELDLDKLEYLDMVIKESLRIHPVAPLLIPHQSMEDCIVGDYFIPKKSRVLVNSWAIMRDPNAWTDPEKFWPERFEGSNIDVRGRDFQLLPFGAGRRGCPGLQLGLTIIRLVVAQLVHCFDWKLPNDMLPTELDMTEEFGLSMPRANHLVAIPTYRLHV